MILETKRLPQQKTVLKKVGRRNSPVKGPVARDKHNFKTYETHQVGETLP
jgi:hypothetical protein